MARPATARYPKMNANQSVSPLQRLWRVVLPRDCSEDGLFDVEIWACDRLSAALLAADELAVSTHTQFSGSKARTRWIHQRATAAVLVDDVQDVVARQLFSLFASCSPPPPSSQAHWPALMALMRLHRCQVFPDWPPPASVPTTRLMHQVAAGDAVRLEDANKVHTAVRAARDAREPFSLTFK